MADHESAGAERPAPRVMASTEVPGTVTRTDGTVDTGTVRVVHPAGTPAPPRIDHQCGPTCGRCPQ